MQRSFLTKIYLSVFVFFIFLVTGVVFYSLPSNAQKALPSEIQMIMDKPLYRHAAWGLLVKELKTGKTVYALNADRLFIPASTTKLFSTAAALDIFGPDYRYKTYVYRRGNVSASGVLNGDLILVSSGDFLMDGRTDKSGHVVFTAIDHTNADAMELDETALTKPDPVQGLRQLAKQVAISGIRHIKGDVIIDDRIFERYVNIDREARGAVVINDNVIDFVITPAAHVGQLAQITWRPHCVFYPIDAHINTVPAGQETSVTVTAVNDHSIVLRGQIALDHKSLLKTYSITDSASFARALFIDALKVQGIMVDSSPLAKNPSIALPDWKLYETLPSVAVLTSAPFSEYIKLILKVSHNLGADLLISHIAVHHGYHQVKEGFRFQRESLKKLGVDVTQISISDGEGGEIGDMISPEAVTSLLIELSKQPYFKIFRESLPSLGLDGTLAGVLDPKSEALGKAQAKTGTLSAFNALNNTRFLRSKGLGGYLNAASDRQFVFALYVNNVLLQSLDSTDVLNVGKDLAKIVEVLYKKL
jgi:serine-type D-Ala-D-Ala carboxypeptidase/endopeptidase (penicillin-binding protein 4)